MWLSIVFTASTMSAVSFCLIARVTAAQGRSILQSASVGFLTGPRNYAAALLSCAHPRPTVVVRIFLLTVCYAGTYGPDFPAAVTVVMLWAGYAGRSVILASY